MSALAVKSLSVRMFFYSKSILIVLLTCRNRSSRGRRDKRERQKRRKMNSEYLRYQDVILFCINMFLRNPSVQNVVSPLTSSFQEISSFLESKWLSCKLHMLWNKSSFRGKTDNPEAYNWDINHEACLRSEQQWSFSSIQFYSIVKTFLSNSFLVINFVTNNFTSTSYDPHSTLQDQYE